MAMTRMVFMRTRFSAHVPDLIPPAFSWSAFSWSGLKADRTSDQAGGGEPSCALPQLSRLARLRLSVARGVYRLSAGSAFNVTETQDSVSLCLRGKFILRELVLSSCERVRTSIRLRVIPNSFSGLSCAPD